jgi:hypothetical protein
MAAKLFRMKANFGHGIFVFIVLFMVGILILVYKSSQNRVDLVSATYYEQELKYSEQMKKETNSIQLENHLKIGYDKQQHLITVNYPSSSDFKSLNGTISFYKPDNALLDFSKTISTDAQLMQTIHTIGMAHGYWSVKVNWTSGSTPYYSEQKIFID